MLRRLAAQAGVSNPYLSQIERGLRQPSAEILNQIAKGLHVFARALYVRAMIIEDREIDSDASAAIRADLIITERQCQVLITIYASFRKEDRAEISRAQPTQPDEPPPGETILWPNGYAVPNYREGRLMALTRQIKKIAGSKPFYAVAGATDYGVEKLSKASKRLRKLQPRRGEVRQTAKDLPGKARETVAQDLPEQTRGYIGTAAAKVNEFYDVLAARGRKIVSRASREAAHELEEVSESAEPATAPKKGRAPAEKPAPRRGRRATTTSKA